MTTNTRKQKYKETECQEQEFTKMNIESSNDEALVSCYGVLQNGQEIRSNFSIVPSNLRKDVAFNYFLIDKEDEQWIEDVFSGKLKYEKKGEYLLSLESFSSDRKKKLYIRAMPSTIQISGKTRKIKKLFTDDVLELIPIALKQQNTHIDASDDRLEKYRQKWKCTDKHVYNTINIEEFKEVLEEFDINKEEITIVPDIVYELTANELHKHPEAHSEIFSSDGKKVMEPVQAAFGIFQEVCGYNWNVKSCKKHSKCLDFIRNIVISAIREFEEMDQKLFVAMDYVREIVKDLNKSICRSSKEERNMYKQLLELPFEDDIYLHDYWKITDSHGLPRFNNFLMDPLENNFSVWNARMFLIAGWIQQLFGLEMRQLRTFLAKELVSRRPEESRGELNAHLFKRSIVLGDAQQSDESDESEESSDEESTIITVYSIEISSSNKQMLSIEKKMNQLKVEPKSQNLTPNKNSVSEKKTKTKHESSSGSKDSSSKGQKLDDLKNNQDLKKENNLEKVFPKAQSSISSTSTSKKVSEAPLSQSKGVSDVPVAEKTASDMKAESKRCSTFKLKMTTNPPKYKETVWQEQEIENLKMYIDVDEPLTSCFGILPNGKEIQSNFSLIPSSLRKTIAFDYFLIDKDDEQWIKDVFRGNHERNGEYLLSLELFSSDRKKKLYVRTMPSEIQISGKTQKTKKMFTDDVLKLIPIALKQQNTPINASDDRLEKYRQKWKCTDKHLYNTIDIEKFKEVLEEFDINKEEITIVPDTVHKLTTNELDKHPENIAETFSTDGKYVMEPIQAAFAIFQSVCGYNWNVKSCKKHPKCLDFMRNIVIAAIREFEEMDQKLFVTVDYVRKVIGDLKKSICRSPKEERCKYKQLLDLNFSKSVSLHDYWQITDSHGLPRFSNFLMDPLDNTLTVWNARMFLIAGWIQQFFVLELRQSRTFLATELVTRCPKESRDAIFSLKRGIVFGESEESEGSIDDGFSDKEATSKYTSEKEENTRTQMPIEEKVNKLKIEPKSKNLTTNKDSVSEKETKTKHESSFGSKDSSSKGQNLDALKNTQSLKKENILEKSFTKEQSSNGSAAPPSQSKGVFDVSVAEKKGIDIKTESKCCQKCLRTSEMCNEAKKELKTTQNKLAKLEKKAKNFDEVEKKMKEQDKEIEQLKKEVQEMKKMKSRLAQYESAGAKIKETDDRVTKDRLQVKLAQLEAQLKNKENNSQMSQLEREITEKDETIALLQETNMRVTVRNEEQARNIQNLLDRLTMANSNQTR